jgi:hypothetical protein
MVCPRLPPVHQKNLRLILALATVRVGPRGRCKPSKAESEIERPSLLEDRRTLNMVLTGDTTES